MFSQAQRTQLYLRMALDGSEGSGKSYTAMKLMYYLLGGEQFFLIDAERGRSRLYATPRIGDPADPDKGKFVFQSVELDNYAPANYMAAMKEAVTLGAKGIVIDGISQAWEGKGGLLEQKQLLDKKGGNSYTNWLGMGIQQNEFIAAMLDLPCHLIVTMRSKVEHVIEKDPNGKTLIRKIGLQPVQRDGVGYEFDVMGRMENATMEITKVRNIDSLIGKTFEKPGIEVAAALNDWLGIGAEMPLSREQFIAQMTALGYDSVDRIAAFTKEHPDLTGPYRYNALVKAAQG